LTAANRSLRRQNIFAVLSLILVDLLIYGPFLRSLGFSHDDWPVVSVYSLFGHAGVRTYFTNNRPVYGWLTNQLFVILGVHPVGWHFVILVALALTGIATFFTFRALWPARADLAWLTAVLVLLYPGFTQQSESLSFIPHYVSLLLFVLSLRSTIAALDNPNRFWLFTAAAIVLALSSYTLIEYYLGLELFRLLVIAYRTRLTSTRKTIIPYLAAWVPFVLFKGLFTHVDKGNSYRDPSVGLHNLVHHPLSGLLDRAGVFVHNIIFGGFLAWARPFGPDLFNRSPSGLVVEYGLGVSVAVIAVLMLRYLGKPREPNRQFCAQALLAIGGLLVSGIPLVLSSLCVQFAPFPSFEDRFALPFILASAFFLAVVLIRAGSGLLIAGLLCLFTVFQAQNQVNYAHDWARLRSLFWQEAWRAPMLEVGTGIYLDGTPKTVIHDHNAGMLDLLYGAKPAPQTLDYYIYDLQYFRQPNLKPGSIAFGSVREFQFHGQVANSLVQWLSPNGVLHTVDNSSLLGIRYSGITDALAPISAPSRVIEDKPLTSYRLLAIFGKEPQHDWSYYYQRAELKSQEGDWESIALLGDAALHSGYEPVEGTELYPFIEGYALVGRYSDAAKLTENALTLSPELEQPLSTLWNSALSHAPTTRPAPDNIIQALGKKLDVSSDNPESTSIGTE
jgi:hypothetical protein